MKKSFYKNFLTFFQIRLLIEIVKFCCYHPLSQPNISPIPNMWLSPSVAGALLLSGQLPISIHSVSSASIFPLSWKFKIANDTSLVHGECLGSPIPYAARPNSSPAVVREQSFEDSWYNTGESHMNAFNFLEIRDRLVFMARVGAEEKMVG